MISIDLGGYPILGNHHMVNGCHWFQKMVWHLASQRFKMIYAKKAKEHCYFPMVTPLLPNCEDLLLSISRLYGNPVDHDFRLAVNTIKHLA